VRGKAPRQAEPIFLKGLNDHGVGRKGWGEAQLKKPRKHFPKGKSSSALKYVFRKVGWGGAVSGIVLPKHSPFAQKNVSDPMDIPSFVHPAAAGDRTDLLVEVAGPKGGEVGVSSKNG